MENEKESEAKNMEPIINPWIVYWAEKCKIIQMVFGIFAIFAATAIIFWYLLFVFNEVKHKPPKWFVAMIVLCSITAIFTPSEKTVLTMATLNCVTSDNIEKMGNAVDTVIDYVADKIEEILDSE